MKNAAILLFSLLVAVDAAAQSPSGGSSRAPVLLAQGGASAPAGSAATGATLPPAHNSSGSGTLAAVGLGVAGFAAAAFGYNNTAANH